MADFIDTKVARQRIATNSNRIKALEKEISVLEKFGAKSTALPGKRQQLQDLKDENALLQKQIDAQHNDASGGVSGTNVNNTTGNFTTVPTTNSFANATGATDGDGDGVADATQPGTDGNVLVLIGAGLVVVMIAAWGFLKRGKRGN